MQALPPEVKAFIMEELRSKVRSALTATSTKIDLRRVLEAHEPGGMATGHIPFKHFLYALKSVGITITPQEKEFILHNFADYRGVVNYAR